VSLPQYPAQLKQPKAWLRDEPPEAYGKFETLLAEASQREVLSDLPASLEESGAAPGRAEAAIDYELRAQVIGERLWLLGYLALEDKLQARRLYSKDQAAFLDAVSRFQDEAGLIQDGWVGKKTWTLLSNLVNFEPLPREAGVTAEQALEDEPWNKPLGAGLNNRAVMRAAALRLHVLGLAKQPPGRGTAYRRPDQQAVTDFHRLLWSLGLVDRLFGDRLTKTSLPLLMNHDVIVEAVAASDRNEDDRFDFRRDNDWPQEAFTDMAQLFLTRLVQIELWLLGFDIDLQQLRRYACSGIRKRPVFDPFEVQADPLQADFYDPGGELEGRLREYYREFCGLGKIRARRFAEEIRPSLFQSLLNPRNEQVTAATRSLTEAEAYEAVLGSIQGTAKAEELLDTGRSLGLRIWDGLKRIWRWFKRQIVRVIEFGTNLARAFYRYASKGFSIVRRAVRAVVSSVQRYVTGEFDFAGVNIRLDKDFDSLLLTPPHHPAEQVCQAGDRLQLFASRFLFAGRILGLVFRALVLSGMQRWARLAMTLAGELKRLIPLYRELVGLEAGLPAEMR
jgi:hypothetical protein